MLLNIINGTQLDGYGKVIYLYNDVSLNSYEDLITVPYKKYCNYYNNRVGFVRIFKRLMTLIEIVRKENVKLICSFASQGALLGALVKIMLPFRKIKVVVRLGTVFTNLFYAPRGSLLKRRIWERATLSFTYRCMSRIVCLTNYMRQELISKSKQLGDKIVVIKNYVDKNHIEELASEPIPIKEKYFISVGRLEREKNFEGIITAFNAIKDSTRINLIILGDGSLRTEILQTISYYGLQKRVLLLGFEKNPYNYIAHAQGLLLFSNFEGLPNVVIEAQICKTPVIVSNYPGVEDIITHDSNGIIVQRGDCDDLASSMANLSKDKTLRNRLVNNGYKTALEFTRSIRQYDQLMSELL